MDAVLFFIFHNENGAKALRNICVKHRLCNVVSEWLRLKHGLGPRAPEPRVQEVVAPGEWGRLPERGKRPLLGGCAQKLPEEGAEEGCWEVYPLL